MSASSSNRWARLYSERGPTLKIFNARFDYYRNPRNDRELRATVLEAPDWANVVAITDEKRVVLVRQFRLGIGQETTEIPAGIVERDETPLAGAQRELAEETGYTSRRWRSLGWVYPNPAFLTNRCHLWLALDAVQTGQPKMDDGEDIQVSALSLEEVQAEIKEGKMRNALGLLALARVFEMHFEWDGETEARAETGSPDS